LEWKGEEGATPLIQRIGLHSIRDMSSTWGHEVYRFEEDPIETATWGDPVIVESGPIMASIATEGKIGQNRLRAIWRVYADEPFAELSLTVHWQDRFRLLKLVLPFRSEGAARIDGIMGDSLERANNGIEWPVRDWTLMNGADGRKLGIVCPDVYSLDATNERLRLTLLRSPLMAHHGAIGRVPNYEFSDQGVHRFRFRFFLTPDVTCNELERHAMMIQRPLVFADLTKGMPPVVIASETPSHD